MMKYQFIAVMALCCPVVAHADEILKQSADTRVVYRNEVSTIGSRSNIDVFWCQDGSGSDNALAQATQLATTLSIVAKLEFEKSNIGEIRTRPITQAILKKQLSAADVVRLARAVVFQVDQNDLNLQKIINRLQEYTVGTSSFSYELAQTQNDFSPSYAAMYVCSGIDPNGVSGLVYFQAKDAESKSISVKAIQQLGHTLPGLNVDPQVELIKEQFPQKSEFRYFYPDDAETAAQIANQIEVSTGVKFTVKQIKGYEGKVKNSTFEAWVTK